MSARRIVNALTIDVEDYFQVSAFAPYIRRDEWEQRECRVERNVDRILVLLDQNQRLILLQSLRSHQGLHTIRCILQTILFQSDLSRL